MTPLHEATQHESHTLISQSSYSLNNTKNIGGCYVVNVSKNLWERAHNLQWVTTTISGEADMSLEEALRDIAHNSEG